MKTLISKTPKLSPSIFYHFPSLSRKNPNFLSFPNRKCLWQCTHKGPSFSSATAADSPSYGGWEDPGLGSDSVPAGESTQLRNFLNSLGIDDKKHVFVYLLGFVCALAISRVRVSSIVVFPACAIVFAVGFSVGFVNGGHVNELSSIGFKKRRIDDKIAVSVEKLRGLVGLLDGFDGKVHDLTRDINGGIERNRISVGDLKRCVNVIESIGLSAKNASIVVEACIDGILVENQELERSSNQKSSKRRKELGEKSTGVDLFQFVGSLFRENMAGSKPKNKECVKKDVTHLEVNDQNRENILAQPVEESVVNSVSNVIQSVTDQSRENILASSFEKRLTNSVSNGNVRNGYVGFSGDISNKPDIGYGGMEKISKNENTRMNGNVGNYKIEFPETNSGARKVLGSEEYIYPNNGLQFKNNQPISLKIGQNNEVENWTSSDGLLDSVDLTTTMRMETEETFGQERMFEKSNRDYEASDKMEKSEKEAFESRIKEESAVPKGDFGFSPTSAVSDDMVFNSHLMEANGLIKQARESLRHRDDIELAENVLNKSANLLSRAIDMKPMSLLAVGQLGNTYLLHGELKLMISRDLRALLERSDPISVGNWSKVVKGLDDRFVTKEKIASALVNVCEECEELLVESGRKYRLALSIDGNDMRALYNWGLALSFRAQLIADIGPEAAFDADKVFLAAIDKFDTMMSKSNVYAPDALFRWGVALQQRSRLRPRNSKEKVKLLQQAKRLYEDALDMNSNNLQLRKALSSCISELNFRNY